MVFNKLWLKFYLLYTITLVMVIGTGIGLHSREFAQQMASEYTERGVFLMDVFGARMQPLLAGYAGEDLARAARNLEARESFAAILAGTTGSPGILFAGIYGRDGRPVVESGKLSVAGRFDPGVLSGKSTMDVRHATSSQGAEYLLLTRAVLPSAGAPKESDEASFLYEENAQVGATLPSGYLRIGFSLAPMQARVQQMNAYIITLALAMLLFCAGAIYLFLRRMLLPIRRLQEATRIVASGDLNHRVDVRTRDEIGSLAGSFNEMTRRLRDSQTQIERHAEELESRVVARTREIQAAYEELKQTQAQLLQSEKMASIGQLAAGVAHEINNPMGFIQSNLGTLSDYSRDLKGLLEAYGCLEERIEEGDERGARGAVGKIRVLKAEMDLAYILEDLPNLVSESREGADRVRKIVQDLKEFSHVDQAESKAFSVTEGLESTLNIVWNELKYKATVVKSYGDLPEVVGFPMQLNQVFMNMLVNAAQAIEGKGEIGIRTYQDGGWVCVEISDTGAGMPAEVRERIFEPFYTTKEVGKGTGLGLSVSYNIVKKHNGEIRVDSTVGRGTTFTIRLPGVCSLVRPDGLNARS